MYQIDEENSDILFEVSDKTVILKLKSGVGSGGSSPDIYLIKLGDLTTPSDKNAFSSLRAQSTFLRKDQVDSTSFLLKLLAGLETGEYSVGESGAKIDADGDAEVRNLITRIKATVAALEAKTVTVTDKITTLNLLVQKLAETYNLNVSNVATLFQTIVKDYVSSESFVPGITGEGMKLYKALNGDWNLEVDNVTIRKAMTVFELIISKVRAVNGGLVVSPANGRIKSVTETTGSPTYYVLGIEGDMTFVADDLVRCQVFSSTGAKYYWVPIDSVSGETILILKSNFPDGVVPAIGDDLVQMGNKTNTARQGVLYLTASEDGKPRFSVLDGVNSTDLTGKSKVILGCLDGITDSDFPSDAQPHGYGLWAGNVFLKGLFILRNGKSIEDELSDQITAVQTAFEIREGQISTKVTQATQAAAEASGYAASAAGSASSAGQSLTAITQKESSITQTANEITLKVTRAETAAGRAESAEASINIKADGIVLQASNQAAQTAVNGVQVGGKNLFLNSWIIKNNTIVNVVNNGSTLSVDSVNTYLGQPTLRVVGTYGFYINYIPTIEPNTTYTISMMVKGDSLITGDTSTPLHIQVPAGNHNFENHLDYSTSITTGWKQIWKTFRSTTDGNTTLRLFLYNIGNVPCNVAWVKLEKGTKATDWTPAPEDVDADIALRPTTEYLKSQFIITPGGISLIGKALSLAGMVTFSSLDSDSQGRITTAQSTASSAVSAANTAQGTANTANSTANSALSSANTANSGLNTLKGSLGGLAYLSAVSLAKLDSTIVEGGYIKTSLIDADAIVTGQLVANIIFSTNITTGKLTVTTGAKVAGFKVSGNSLTNEGFDNDAYIIMRNDNLGTFVGIGGNVANGISEFATTARIENNRKDSPVGNVIALRLSASGCQSYYSNVALDIVSGCISGFRLKLRTVTTPQTLSVSDSIIITERDSGDITLTLPSNAEKGQMYFIRKNGGSRIYINGSYIINDGDWYREKSTSVQLNRGALGILIYNGTYWTWNNMNG